MLAGKARRIICMCGAGISVNAGALHHHSSDTVPETVCGAVLPMHSRETSMCHIMGTCSCELHVHALLADYSMSALSPHGHHGCTRDPKLDNMTGLYLVHWL